MRCYREYYKILYLNWGKLPKLGKREKTEKNNIWDRSEVATLDR